MARRGRKRAFSRHCEPTGRANARPMAGSAKQSILSLRGKMDCFAALAMTAGAMTMRPNDWARRMGPGVRRDDGGVGIHACPHTPAALDLPDGLPLLGPRKRRGRKRHPHRERALPWDHL